MGSALEVLLLRWQTKHIIIRNVGIGTDDPKTKLEVSGDLNIKATSDTWNTSVGKGLYMRFYDGVNKGYIQSIDRSSSDTHYPLIYHASQHDFNDKTTTHMRIETNGYVGIGTTNPGAKLHVKDTGSAGAILIENESLALLQLKQSTLNKYIILNLEEQMENYHSEVLPEKKCE